MAGAGIFERLGIRNPLKRTRCVRVCMIVLFVQAWLLLIFNSNLMSRDHLTTAPLMLHQDVRNMGGITSPSGSRRDSVEEDLFRDTLDGPDELGRRWNTDPPNRDRGDVPNSPGPAHDESNRNQMNQIVPGGSDDSFSSPLKENVHQREVKLTTRETHQQRWEKTPVINDQDPVSKRLPGRVSEKPPVVLERQVPVPKRPFVERVPPDRPLNVNQQQEVLPTQKSHQFGKMLRNVDQEQHGMPKARTRNPWMMQQRQERRSDGEDSREASEEGAKKRDFYAHVMKGREKAVLSPGCPDRGISNRVPSLAFVKVHKSASTTVANILARYALRHTLNVALPRKVPGAAKFNYFPTRITPKDVLPAPAGQGYQVVFNHMIFHRQDMDVFMPNATFYLAIMRDPLDRFVSSFAYYGLADYFNRTHGLADMKEAVAFFLRLPGIHTYTLPEVYNSLASDTGLPPASHRDARAVQAHIHRTESELDLVMVVEYFDESLVLLKRKACLTTQEVLYLVKNVRSRQKGEHVHLTPEERAAFDRYQMADVLMYRHFYQRFWELVFAQGPDFMLEVRQFKETQRTVRGFCSRVVDGSVWDFLSVPRSAWNEGFVVTGTDCRLMRLPELTMQYRLMRRAIRLYNLRVKELSAR